MAGPMLSRVTWALLKLLVSTDLCRRVICAIVLGVATANSSSSANQMKSTDEVRQRLCRDNWHRFRRGSIFWISILSATSAKKVRLNTWSYDRVMKNKKKGVFLIKTACNRDPLRSSSPSVALIACQLSASIIALAYSTCCHFFALLGRSSRQTYALCSVTRLLNIARTSVA